MAMSAPFYATGAFSEQTGFIIIFFVGLAFGFFLERAGFASARKLTAVFYFRDWSVVQMMFTALITAMVGLLFLRSVGWLAWDALTLETTFIGAQIVGGLLLGMGFVAGGYCPGTSVVAAASGRVDGILFIAGLLLGNAIFGFGYGLLLPLYNSGARNVYSLADWTGLGIGTIGFLVVLMALGAFAAIEYSNRTKAGHEEEAGRAGESPSIISAGGITMRLTWKRLGAGLVFGFAFILMVGTTIAGSNSLGNLSMLVSTGKDQIEPAELASWIAQHKPAMIIDLRGSDAFTEYHIPGSKNMTFDQLSKADLPKDQPIFLYSADGVRAGQAWTILAGHGLDVRVLKGGLRAWWAEIATPSDLRAGGGNGQAFIGAAVAGGTSAAQGSAPAPKAPPGGAKFKKGASCL
jgi:rhodanese-related sulfurtransferase